MVDVTNMPSSNFPRHNQHIKVDMSSETPSMLRIRALISDIIQLLGVRRDIEILPRITELITCEKGSHSNSNLIGKIAKLIAECSPTDKFSSGNPTNKDIWRWVRNLMKKYMDF